MSGNARLNTGGNENREVCCANTCMIWVYWVKCKRCCSASVLHPVYISNIKAGHVSQILWIISYWVGNCNKKYIRGIKLIHRLKINVLTWFLGSCNKLTALPKIIFACIGFFWQFPQISVCVSVFFKILCSKNKF